MVSTRRLAHASSVVYRRHNPSYLAVSPGPQQLTGTPPFPASVRYGTMLAT